ncbi:MAG: CopG family antitoxin [Nitrospira sp.]|nr:CopG family antitoxin [Nitrospira sp.]
MGSDLELCLCFSDATPQLVASHDSTAYVDYTKGRRLLFPHLKPSTETISLRLPKSPLDQLETLANKRDVPYHPPLKLFVLERVQAELRPRPAKTS